MANSSGSESDEAPRIDWAILEDELSAGALQSLQQHLKTREAAPTAPAATAATAPLGEGARGEEEVNEASEASPVSSYRGGGKAALPASNLVYKAKDYWDERFQVEQDYDWLGRYADLAEHLRKAIPREARVLIVGCGNSSLSADMYDDGYRDLLSTDFSGVVVDMMRARHEESRPGLRWEKMDMLALDLPDGSVDAVVDKAAMDALLVDKGDPWNPDPGTIERAHRMCSEVSRVLAPGGVFVQLSFEQEHFRKKLLLGDHVTATSAINPAAAATGSNREELVPEGHEGGRGGGGEGGDGGGGGMYGWDMRVENIQRAGGCFGQFLYVMRRARRAGKGEREGGGQGGYCLAREER